MQRFLSHLIVHHAIFTRPMEMANLNHLFTYSRFFNHSCLPNIVLLNINNLNIGIALRPIKPGDQIFKSYFLEDDAARNAKKPLFSCEKKFVADEGAYIDLSHNAHKRKMLTEKICILFAMYRDILWSDDFLEIETTFYRLLERRFSMELEY